MPDEINTSIPDGSGVQIRNHLIKLQSVFGNVNEMADQAEYEFNLVKVKLDEVEDLVDEELQKQSPIRKTRSKKVGRHKVEVVTSSGEVITLLDIKREYVVARFKLSRAKSRVEEIKTAIASSRSILAWDRLELGSTD